MINIYYTWKNSDLLLHIQSNYESILYTLIGTEAHQ